MAEDTNQQKPVGSTNTFSGGMVRDPIDLYKKTDTYYHLRNGCINLPGGGAGGRHTEPGNILCCEFPYPLIGAIPLTEDQWCVFLTDNTTSEIGIFIEGQCTYNTLTGPQTCPNFSTEHLIIGAARRGFDCGFDVYWSDGSYNPDRFINTAKVPFIQTCTTTGGCITCVDTTVLDCEKLRLAPHFTIPCLTLSKSQGSGTLRNGSYQVAVRYQINQIPCTDFVALSPIESLFSHTNLAGALKLTLTGTETTLFTEMEVVLISMVNFQVEARSLGTYSTSQSTIYISDLDLTLPIVPLETIPLNTPAIESSDAMYNVAQYLIRAGPREKPQFNYQLLANQIIAKWACVEYPDTYYHRGGNEFGMNVGHMRDEIYAYYIRWIWTSGDKTASYSIPGLPSGTLPTFFFGGPSVPGSLGTVASGRFVGYSSTEIYDDRHPIVWGPLCGQPIMHHWFPDQALHPALTHFTQNNTIRIMGVYFENIQLPVDNNGNVIQDIQGYEILRAVRDGHQSVIAKGMVNHMRGYKKADGTTGIYQNYPYDDLHADRYLTTDQTIGIVGGTFDGWQGNEQTTTVPDVVSFHSPDTTFQHPYLGSGTLALYQSLAGIAEGSFDIPYKHPKFKTITDLASFFGVAIGAMVVALDVLRATSSGGGGVLTLAGTGDLPMGTTLGMNTYPDGSLGLLGDAAAVGALAFNIALTVVTGVIELKTVQAQVMNIINGLVPPIQYARQYNSHGFYDTPVFSPKFTYTINDYQYIGGQLQTFGAFDVNNLYRNDYVAINIEGALPAYPYTVDPVVGGSYGNAVKFLNTNGPYTGNISTFSVDCSRFTLGQGPSSPYPPGPRSQLGPFQSPIISWYGAYKVPQPAQYGQVDSPKQAPISCVYQVDVTSTATYSTPVLFGGDTYINRYTEKNPFFFFNDWLFGQETDYIYDYTQYENVPYPRYWINNTKVYYDFWATASKNWHFDEVANSASIWSFPNVKFYVESGYFYLFNNGVRDFYVESGVNVGYRDWEDDHSKRFYDPYGYTSLDYMFRSDIIKSDILYKYDYSLSAGKFWDNYISWGKCLRRDYDPILAYTCFSYYPRRVVYSLPQSEELIADNWRLFLPNNYKDFPTTVTAMKEIHKSGALILLKDEPPQQFTGTDILETANGVKVTLGDGGLFAQSLQSVSNADISLQYGSCQNRLSIVNTPHGVFWVSRDTGKIFSYTGHEGMQDISTGLKYDLSLYLPSQLLQQFPTYPLHDNPLSGIGIQCIYDAINEVLYICKKDYKARDTSISFDVSTGGFYTVLSVCPSGYTLSADGSTCISNFGLDPLPPEGLLVPISFTDDDYFEDCSWTLSWDCRGKQWIGFHDWQPALNIPAKTHFLTTNSQTNAGASAWRHNLRTDLFCQYYGIPAPFEIGYYAGTGADETTLASVTLILEAYQYRTNNVDRFQQYGNFFDTGMIFNPEQHSFYLNFTLQPWDDPYAGLAYPFFTAGAYNILYTKRENIYQFNTFFDFTNDRGQFTLTGLQAMTTNNNWYTVSLNNAYFDFAKSWDQQKRMRYRGSQVWLRKSVVGGTSISMIASGTKNIISP